MKTIQIIWFSAMIILAGVGIGITATALMRYQLYPRPTAIPLVPSEAQDDSFSFEAPKMVDSPVLVLHTKKGMSPFIVATECNDGDPDANAYSLDCNRVAINLVGGSHVVIYRDTGKMLICPFHIREWSEPTEKGCDRVRK